MQPLYVLYGSNTGTSESFTQRIASDAPAYSELFLLINEEIALIHSLGFQPSIGTLDSATNQFSNDGPVMIVMASFKDKPANRATKFMDQLSHVEGSELSGV